MSMYVNGPPSGNAMPTTHLRGWTPPPHLLGGEDVVLRLRGGGGSDGGAKAVRGDAGGGGLDAVGRRPPRSLELL